MNYVYIITNTLNNKRYVGVTNNPERRWHTHCRIALTPRRVRYLVHDAIAKYGIEAFRFEIVESYELRATAFEAESRLIKQFGSLGDGGYNLNSGGVGPVEFSDRTRHLISEAAKRRFSNEDERKRHSETCKGTLRSEETRRRMSAAQRGRIQSEETRRKISEAKVGKHLNIAPEVQERLSAFRRQRKLTDEHKQKLIDANHRKAGKPLSEEHKAKLRAAWVRRLEEKESCEKASTETQL